MHDDISGWLEARVDIYNAFANYFGKYYDSPSDMPQWAQWAQVAERVCFHVGLQLALQAQEISII